MLSTTMALSNMARVKTAYKPKAYRDGGAVPLTIQVDTPEAHIAADYLAEKMQPIIEAQHEAQHDESTVAFQKQLDALQGAESIHRDRAEQQKRVEQILAENPEMLAHPEITKIAEREALRSGLEPYSEEFHQAVKRSFDLRMKYATGQAQLPPIPSEPVENDIQTYDLPELRNNNRFVSAPVSRETGATGFNHDAGPGKVRLTVAMKEAARIAGISEAEYAAQVLRLREEKEAGNYGGSP